MEAYPLHSAKNLLPQHNEGKLKGGVEDGMMIQNLLAGPPESGFEENRKVKDVLEAASKQHQ